MRSQGLFLTFGLVTEFFTQYHSVSNLTLMEVNVFQQYWMDFFQTFDLVTMFPTPRDQLFNLTEM